MAVAMPELLAADHAVLDRAMGEPMLDQVLDWSAVNSGSRNLDGLARMAVRLADNCAQLPGSVELLDPERVMDIAPDGTSSEIVHGQNLRVTVRPDAPVQLLFTGHMDTVFEASSPFQVPVWSEPGVLNGPGVADMKGGIAVMLAALKAFELSPDRDRIGYQIVLNSDEETGSRGSDALLRSCAVGKRAALTYEPSAAPDGTLAGARPGSGNFALIFSGRSAHAGRNPQDGRNALIAAADAALRLTKLVQPGLSVNCAKIEGGSPNNVVPDHAILRVNMRPATPEKEAQARSALRMIVDAVVNEHEVAVHVHGGFNRPPKPLNADTETLLRLVQNCGRLLNQDIGWRDTGGVCDGNNIAACGVPVVDTMGVRGGSIHSPAEYLITESLAERSALSALLLCVLARS